MTESEKAQTIPCPWCNAAAWVACEPLAIDWPVWPGVHAGRISASEFPPSLVSPFTVQGAPQTPARAAGGLLTD